MKKRFISILLAMMMIFSIFPLDVTAEENNQEEITSKELMDSYASVVVYAAENDIPLGMSLDVYENFYAESGYESVEEYESATIGALEHQDSITMENYLDKSPLLYFEKNSNTDLNSSVSNNEESKIDPSEPISENIQDQLHESFSRFDVYMKESGLDYELTYEQYVNLYSDNNFTVEEFETFMEYTVDQTVSPNSTWFEQYFNNCGTSLPYEARYDDYNVIASVKKGDIFHESTGIASLTGHIGIVVGRFYDANRKKSYIRCVEAILAGVKYGIVDDGRIDLGGVTMYRVSDANSYQIDAAVDFCISQLNKNWSIVGLEKKVLSSGHWYCSELVWAGYYRNGFDLDAGNLPGVEPSEMIQSPELERVYIGSSYRPSRRLTDISGHWGYNAIRFAADYGIVSPVTASTYSPNTNATRQVCIQSLYQMSDGQEYYSFNPFSDVSAFSSYRDAIVWGYENNIISGTGNGQFSPSLAVKRQDFAVMLYKFAQYRGYSPYYNNNALNQFVGSGDVSSYALPAMKWAVTHDIMNGRTNIRLDPTGTITRAELASMIYKFYLNIL